MENYFYETIIAKLQSGIIVIDQDCRIEMVNKYVADCCGLPLEEFKGKSLNNFSPKLYEKILEGKITDEISANFCGTEKIIGFNLSALTDEDGKLVGSIINLKDLSEIVAIRKDLREKQRLAAMGEVVGKVAHEMRNPLFGITAAAQILEMELPLAQNHQELMDSLLRESRRLNNLVEVLEECTCEIRLSKKRVNLIRLLDESLQEVAAMMQEKGLSLCQQYDREIWLSADEVKLKQVLTNLLKNAVDASAFGGKVTLSVIANEDGVAVTITDQGHGIPPENLEKVFNLFYTTRKNRSGLGLPSCRAIVAAHGGTLLAGNSPDGGATFLLHLPLGDSPL